MRKLVPNVMDLTCSPIKIDCDDDYSADINDVEKNHSFTDKEWLAVLFSFLPLPYVLLKIPLIYKLKASLYWIPQTAMAIIMLIGFFKSNMPVGMIMFEGLLLHVLSSVVYWYGALLNYYLGIDQLYEQMRAQLWKLGFLRSRDFYSRLGSYLFIFRSRALQSHLFASVLLKERAANSKLTWTLLTENHKPNLAQFWKADVEVLKTITKRDDLDGMSRLNIIKETVKWGTDTQGLEMLHFLCTNDKVRVRARRFLTLIMVIAVTAIVVISQALFGYIVGITMYTVNLRLLICWGFVVAGALTCYNTMKSPISECIAYTSPENYIDIDKLYKSPSEPMFLINIFCVKTLETYLTCVFKLRKAAMTLASEKEVQFKLMIIFCTMLVSVGLAGSYLDYMQTEIFGYGYFNIVMIMGVIANLMILASYLYFGALFNSIPQRIILKLRKILIIINDMKKYKKDTIKSQRLEFLHKCFESSSGDLDEIEEMVQSMLEKLEIHIDTESYKFFGVLTCSTDNITTIFVPIVSLLWVSVVNAISIMIDIIQNPRV